MSEPIDISKDIKKAERKKKWEARKNKALEWWDENKQYVVIAVPIIGGVAKKAINVYSQHQKVKAQELRLWDPVLGQHWQLRRKLTNNERMLIERYKGNGISIGEILFRMKVLK